MVNRPTPPTRTLRVEVAYALRERQVLLAVEVDEGSTVGQAIRRSGIVRQFPDIDLARGMVGVFGRTVSLDTPLRNGDRVEIYRSLIADPKQARRERARRPTSRSRG